MASAFARASAIDLLEQAVHTLRAAPLATPVCHWIGSVPFALGLLVFWNDMTGPRTSDATCAKESLALAGLLLWMNCWRTVFAGRVERQVGGRAAEPWTRRRLWRLVASQAVCGGTKLVVLPLALVITLPLAWVVGFYRYAGALAGGEDLDLPQLFGRARKLAGFEQRQSWGLLLILSILYVILLVNIAIVLAVLPQLVRILTGYESVFSRSGTYFVDNPMFWLGALALAWLALDPFVQAVYCVRCFQLESRETGEDLRAALRMLRKSAAAAVLAVMLCTAGRAQVTPANLDRSIEETLRSPEYGWQAASDNARAARVPWLVAVTDRVVDSAKQALRSMARAIDQLAEWLREKFGRPSKPEIPAPPGAALHWSIYLLIAAIAGLAVLIAWRLRRAGARKPALVGGALGAAIRLEDEHLLADQLPEERWMALAESCEREQDLRSALRALYLANLAWLGHGEWIAIHAGKTNREYELEVRRKARAFPEACAWFAQNIASFERAWYGFHEVSAADTEAFRERVLQMKSEMAQAEIAA